MDIIYEPHPVTPERKAELRKKGLKIVDAKFDPNRKNSGESANPDAVRKKTYWKNSDTGEVGVTEKGEVLPEGVETITKKEHDEAAGQKGH